MELWVNSADVNEIKIATEELNVTGCTTNPKNTAVMGGDYIKNLTEICGIVNGPVCAQVMSTKWDDMVEEAKIIDSIHQKTLVKIPMGVEGIKAIRELKKIDIKVNVTVIFGVAQALLALREGADYVSIFTGPFASVNDSEIDMTVKVKKIIDNYNFNTKIIDCVRSPIQTVNAALIGADICTMDYIYLKMLFEHNMTDSYLKKFHDAWNKRYGEKNWIS